MYGYISGVSTAPASVLAAFGGSDVILNGGAAVSSEVVDTWSAVWDDVLKGGIYHALCNAAILVALVCLMMFVVQFARKWLDSGSGGDWVVADLFIPILVIMLLTSQGALLAKVSIGMRDIINDVNNKVLTTTASSAKFDQTISGLSDHNALKGQLQKLRSNCNSIVDNAELTECLENAGASAELIIAQYNKRHGAANTLNGWGQDLQDYAKEAFSDPLTALQTVSTAPAAAAGAAASAALNGAVLVGNFALTGVVEAFLLACMAGFQHMIEASLLLTALIAPIPVAASMLPFGAKPLYAWITGFISLGVMKLSFNIVVGVVGTVIAKAGPTSTEPLVLAVVLGLMAPFLSMGIASGGGMAIFQGIVGGVGAATNYAARKF